MSAPSSRRAVHPHQFGSTAFDEREKRIAANRFVQAFGVVYALQGERRDHQNIC